MHRPVPMSNRGIELELGEEDRAFLQQRIGLFARLSFAIVGTFFVGDVVAWYLLSPLLDAQVFWPQQAKGLLIESGIAAGLLVASVIVRRGSPGAIPLFMFDGLVTLLACSALALLVVQAPDMGISIELMVLLAIQTLLFVHATVVPAPPIRTFLIHTVACVPLFLVAFDRARDSVVASPLDRWSSTVAIAVWGLTFAVVGAIASKIVYRLRLHVRRAQRLGQYRLEEKLGEGGMGVVYRAHHGMLRRPTAIKLLPPSKAGEKTVMRFEREVRNTSRLTHPNTVAIYDFGRTPDGIFYYAMELLEGPNLAQVVEMDGPQPAGRVVHILRQCAGALAEAHEMSLVHRDVKPENVVLCRRGGIPDVVKVVDFGLVKDLGRRDDVALSRADALTGTPLYMAPETITAAETVDERADLYALGGVAWFLLVGRPPFEGRSAIEVCAKQLEQDAPPPSSASTARIPPDLENIVLKLLAKKPEDRFQSASDLERALAECRGLPRWDRSDAEAWWSRHEPAIAQILHPAAAANLTINIERS